MNGLEFTLSFLVLVDDVPELIPFVLAYGWYDASRVRFLDGDTNEDVDTKLDDAIIRDTVCFSISFVL